GWAPSTRTDRRLPQGVPRRRDECAASPPALTKAWGQSPARGGHPGRRTRRVRGKQCLRRQPQSERIQQGFCSVRLSGTEPRLRSQQFLLILVVIVELRGAPEGTDGAA